MQSTLSGVARGLMGKCVCLSRYRESYAMCNPPVYIIFMHVIRSGHYIKKWFEKIHKRRCISSLGRYIVNLYTTGSNDTKEVKYLLTRPIFDQSPKSQYIHTDTSIPSLIY